VALFQRNTYRRANIECLLTAANYALAPQSGVGRFGLLLPVLKIRKTNGWYRENRDGQC
jgi:hypothetical protein